MEPPSPVAAPGGTNGRTREPDPPPTFTDREWPCPPDGLGLGPIGGREWPAGWSGGGCGGLRRQNLRRG